MELAWHDAWQAELRNQRGEWTNADLNKALALPGAHLVSTNPDYPAIAFGDPATADHVATLVPGMKSDHDLAGNARRALALKNAADAHGTGSTASVMWMGYSPPEDLHDAVRKNRAVAAAPALAEFQRQLTVSNPAAHHTVVGHSYGSVVASEAVRHGMKPDDLVLVGSPGTTFRNANDMGLPPGHVWAGANSEDPIVRVSPFLTPDFGGSTVHPGYDANVFGAESPGLSFPGWRHAAAHNAYFDPSSQALGNMAAITAGQYGQVRSPVMWEPIMASNTIGQQFMDLSWRDAWRTELRGRHGEWVSGTGTPAVESLRIGKLLRAAATPLIGHAPQGEAYPGQFSEKLVKFWRDEKDPAANAALNRAGAYWNDGNSIGTARELRAAAAHAASANDTARYQDLATDIETAGHTKAELTKAVLSEAARAKDIVPGLLGSHNEIWNGKVRIFPVAEKPETLAELDWDGTLLMQDQVAVAIKEARDHPDQPVRAPDAFEVVVHEMIHGVVPPGSEGENRIAYQDPTGAHADIEEGFTELGASQHAGEYFAKTGLGSRDVATTTMSGLAAWNAAPDALKTGNGWGHYKTETAQAFEWTSMMAQMKTGKPENDPATSAEILHIADQVNNAGAADKPQVMAHLTIEDMLPADSAQAAMVTQEAASAILGEWAKGNAAGAPQVARAVAQQRLQRMQAEVKGSA